MDGQKIIVLFIRDNPEISTYWDKVILETQDDTIQFMPPVSAFKLQPSIFTPLPDLLLLELTDPKKGLKTFLHVHHLASTVPIFVLTGKETEGLALQTMQEGARGCMSQGEFDIHWMSRLMRYAIWRQIYLKELRSLSILEGTTDPDLHTKLSQYDQTYFQTASRIRKSLLLLSRMESLETADARLAKDADDLEAHFYRARLLNDLGRNAEAQQSYFEIIKRSPIPLGMLKRLGSSAPLIYAEAILHCPTDPIGHVHLGDIFREIGNESSARSEYETALSLSPHHPEALKRMPFLSLLEKETTIPSSQPISSPLTAATPLIQKNNTPLPTLLLISALNSALNGYTPLEHLVEDKRFMVTVIAAEFYRPSTPLPPHRLIVNAIGDAEFCGITFKSTQAILARSKAPIINPPSDILKTGRAENAIRLSDIPGLIAPTTLNLPRELLVGPEAYSRITQLGFSYPFLLRVPGFHVGRYFHLIKDERDLTTAVACLQGKRLLLIRYLDTRGADGKFRKYRIVMIGKKLYPAHLAISQQWKIHYFTAEMANHSPHRAEDEAFLKNMEKTLSEKALQAIQTVRDRLNLDYGGIDFGLDQNHQVLLFEANAGMTVSLPDSDPRWDYRREPITRIMEAARQMMLEKSRRVV